MNTIIVATKNKGKLKEFECMFHKLDIQVSCLDEFPYVPEPEENGTTFMDNALLKARYYAQAIGCNCIADDSGIAVAALDGAPGVYSARYAGVHGNDLDNNALLLKNMHGITDRSCKFVCALALVSPQGELIADALGECHGQLLNAPKGDHGFGYDPLFYSLDLNKTLAEANMDEKNSISHRSRALRTIAAKLQELL